MGSIDTAPQFVQANVSYWLDPPKDYTAGTIDQYRRKYDNQPNKVYDMRGLKCTLDVQGFQLVEHQSKEQEFTDTDHIKSTVYLETEELIKQITGAARAHCYSHLVRRSSPEVARAFAADPNNSSTKPLGVTVPSPAAHIDHSPYGSHEILRDNLKVSEEEALKLANSGRRWAIINLWRPIKPVERDPLCVCDARTVEEKDLFEQVISLPPAGTGTFDTVTRGRTFKTIAVVANPKHRWYYASSMKPGEVLCIKIFDSAEGVAHGIPHCSFTLPDSENNETRESIEFRCIVFFDI